MDTGPDLKANSGKYCIRHPALGNPDRFNVYGNIHTGPGGFYSSVFVSSTLSTTIFHSSPS